MAKRNLKDRPEESYWKPVFSAEIVFRIMKIVEKTGLSPTDLVLKWVLQEESLIGIIQAGKDQTVNQPKTAADIPVQKTVTTKKKAAKGDSIAPKSQGYRKELVKRVEKLKKQGITLKKIADTFNDEKVLTVSGTGKWYASSINNLMKSKK